MSTTTSSLAARFRGMQEARTAIEALENHGIDGSDIVLAGRVAHEAAEPGDEARADRRAASHLSRHVAKGVVLGAMIGGAVGVLLGILIASDGAGVLVALLFFGLILGGLVGVFTSYERGVGLSDSWELTFHDAGAGSVWVAIRTTEADTLDRAAEVLRDLHPLEVRRR